MCHNHTHMHGDRYTSTHELYLYHMTPPPLSKLHPYRYTLSCDTPPPHRYCLRTMVDRYIKLTALIPVNGRHHTHTQTHIVIAVDPA